MPRARTLSDAPTDPVRAYRVGCSNRNVASCSGRHRVDLGINDIVLRSVDYPLILHRGVLILDRLNSRYSHLCSLCMSTPRPTKLLETTFYLCVCDVILPTARLGTARELTAVRGAKVAAGAGHTRGRPGRRVDLAQGHGHGHGDIGGGQSAHGHGQLRR